MALIETQPDALAMMYARSLMELVEAKGGKDAAMDTLGELEDIVEMARGDAKFAEFLSSRVLAVGKRSASLERIFKGKINLTTLRFLQVVNEKGRLSHLPTIVAAFDALVQEKFGRVEVDVFTAEPIDPEVSRRIAGRLGEALKKEVIVHPYTDGTMIGGMKLRMGDQLIDASVSTQLRKLKDRLASEGEGKLKNSMGRIIEG
ncbi:ATP synthase F1 subunit delta [bacterium]|nr:MAG: ATP synthase F1 subunit delta [bacterium]